MSSTLSRMRNVAERIVSRALAAGLQAVTLLVIAREIGLASFGVFSVALSVGTIIFSVVGWGASTRVLRIQAEEEQARLISSLFLLRIFTMAITFIGTMSIGLIYSEKGPILVAAMLVTSDTIIDFTQALWAGKGRMLSSSLLVIFQRLLPAIGVTGLAMTGSFSLELVAFMFGIVAVVGLVIPFFSWTRPLAMGPVIRQSTGYWAASLTANLRHLEPVVAAWALSQSGAGAYALAMRLTNPLLIFTSALQTVFTPDMARNIGTPKFERTFRLLVGISAGYGLILVICSSMAADLFVDILGQDYRAARDLIQAMIVAAAISGLSQSFQYRFIALGKPLLAAWAVGLGTSFGLIVLATLGVYFGMTGLWIAPLVVQSIILIVMFRLSRRDSMLPNANEGQSVNRESPFSGHVQDLKKPFTGRRNRNGSDGAID